MVTVDNALVAPPAMQYPATAGHGYLTRVKMERLGDGRHEPATDYTH